MIAVVNVQEMVEALDAFGGHLPVYVGTADAEQPPRMTEAVVDTETVDGALAVVIRPDA